MVTVRQLLDSKGRDIWSVSPHATVYAAIAEMARKRIGAILVLDGGRLVGIFSERDYLTKVVLLDRASRATDVATIMTAPVITIGEEGTIGDCMRLMTTHRIRHVPVVATGRVIGMISIGDVLKQMLSEHEHTIQQLENYITGTG